MTKECFKLEPPGGWSSFTRSTELLALVREHLGDIWDFYGFTSDSCMWSSGTSPYSELCLCFASCLSQDIVDLVIGLSHDESEHFQQLSALLHRLVTDFGLREDLPPSPVPHTL